MKRTIVHFEIAADNVEKLSAFYSGVFDWKFDKTPGPMDYWMINMGEGEGGPGGGMMPKMQQGGGITDYFGVESVDDFSKKVLSLGGKVLMEKQPVPQMGWFAVCQDPEGNVFALWQMDTSAA